MTESIVPAMGVTPSLVVGTGEMPFVVASNKAGKTIPDAYRLVTKGDGNGSTIYALQGYFTWTKGWGQRGGEWRDLETQDSLYAKDDVPFGPLL